MSDLNLERCEKYPSSWQHAVIHMNPFSEELHFDGDAGVREFVRYKFKELERTKAELKTANTKMQWFIGMSFVLALETIILLFFKI